MTSKSDIQGWFERGVTRGATHMIVVCDTFDYDDYPVFIAPEEDVRERVKEYDGRNMQRIMEVYDLNRDMNEQLNAVRVFNY